MTPLFVDSAVVLLAVGGEHPLRPACRGLLERAAQGHVSLHMSVEGGQEFLFHRLRRTEAERALAEFDDLDALVIWHAFDHVILRRARELVGDGHARGRDAVHAATALVADFAAIVTPDRDFEGIPGLARLSPEDA